MYLAVHGRALLPDDQIVSVADSAIDISEEHAELIALLPDIVNALAEAGASLAEAASSAADASESRKLLNSAAAAASIACHATRLAGERFVIVE